MAVVDRFVPVEVVIGLAHPVLFHGESAMIDPRKTAADAGVVAGPLHPRGERLDALGQGDAVFPPSAAMMVRADGRLVAARDHRGAAAGADRRGDEGVLEERPVPREPVDVGCLDRGFSVTGKIRGHVVDDEPDDVRTRLAGGGGQDPKQGEEQGQAHRGTGRLSGTPGPVNRSIPADT